MNERQHLRNSPDFLAARRLAAEIRKQIESFAQAAASNEHPDDWTSQTNHRDTWDVLTSDN